MSEHERVRERYERRLEQVDPSLYSVLRPSTYMALQEFERALIRWLVSCDLPELPANLRVLEVGCGSGTQLLQLIRLGFTPGNLVGYELLEDRAEVARERLPSGVEIVCADATEVGIPNESFDVVLQATVFTSLLDDVFQEKLAARMWSSVKRGGGVLWYDFVYDNPRNPDVRGVPLRRVRQLFPDATMRSWRVTLAPPIARRVTRIHPDLYRAFNALPFLRTHVLCWASKRSSHPAQ